MGEPLCYWCSGDNAVLWRLADSSGDQQRCSPTSPAIFVVFFEILFLGLRLYVGACDPATGTGGPTHDLVLEVSGSYRFRELDRDGSLDGHLAAREPGRTVRPGAVSGSGSRAIFQARALSPAARPARIVLQSGDLGSRAWQRTALLNTLKISKMQ